jgi:hypothetical protein
MYSNMTANFLNFRRLICVFEAAAALAKGSSRVIVVG